jgi:phospholipid-binding lipoprotein MlaA
MRYCLSLILLFLMLVLWAGPEVCPAAGPAADGTVSSAPAAAAVEETKQDAFEEEYTEDEDDADDPFADKPVTIADPIEPFNRAMHTVNDKMYFWLLKPVARGYKVVCRNGAPQR